jgi:glycosyltransferase involved in cell wall biosynthesis
VNQPPQQAVRALSAKHRVFYLHREQQSSTLRNLLTPVDERGRAAAAGAAFGRTRFEQVESSVWIAPLRGIKALAPLYYPEWWRRRVVRGLQHWLMAETQHWQMESPVLWFYWWFLPELAESASGATVYDIIDEHAAYSTNRRFAGANRRAAELERRLARHVDHVFAVSSSLVERSSRDGIQATLLPNGVDLQRTSEALREPSRPADLEHLPRPVVGYIGDVGDRLDWSLIGDLVDRRPDWSFAFVGGDRPRSVHPRPNLHVLHGRPYPEMMRCVREFDVAILPLRLNEFNRSVSALKLLDYLVADRPVVAADLPCVREIGDRDGSIVTRASGLDDWERSIELRLTRGESIAVGTRRTETVRVRSVEARIARAVRVLKEGAGTCRAKSL